MANKSKLMILLLSVVPGLPQIYLGHSARGLLILGLTALYTIADLILAVVIRGEFLVLLFAVPFIWLVALVDAFTLVPRGHAETAGGVVDGNVELDRKKEMLILAALIPGGGQMYLGEVERGLPLLVAFFGWLTFSTYLAVNFAGGFIVLWGLLPIIWVYSFCDALEGWRAQLPGANMVRRPLGVEMEALTGGRRSAAWAAVLSLLPGVGHMYLGQIDKGLGMLGGFLLILLLNDFLRFNLAFVVVPLLWFYSVFDTLAQLPALKAQEVPVTTQTAAVGRWLGYALVGGGILLLLERLVLPLLDPEIVERLQPLVLALVLIAVGVKLLVGGRTPRATSSQDEVAKEGDAR